MYHRGQKQESVAIYPKCALVMVIFGARWVAPAPPIESRACLWQALFHLGHGPPLAQANFEFS